jgi:hypothetical protein
MIITDPSKRPGERLAQVVQGYFADKGYSFKKSTHQFTKTTGNKKDSVFLFYSKTADLVSASLSWAIVFPELEKIYAIIEGEKEKSTVKPSTLWTNLLNYLPRRNNNAPSSFDMFSPHTLRYDDFSINDAAEKLIISYEEYAEPFLHRYNDLRTLEMELNKLPLSHHPYIGYGGRQITFGLVLAKRFNKEKFDPLVIDYRNYIDTAYQDEEDAFRKNMEKFLETTVTYLEQVDINKAIA